MRIASTWAWSRTIRTRPTSLPGAGGGGIGYVSIAEADWDNAPELPEDFRRDLRQTFSGRIIVAGRYTAERGERLLRRGWPI
jgi:hypothetical protein